MRAKDLQYGIASRLDMESCRRFHPLAYPGESLAMGEVKIAVLAGIDPFATGDDGFLPRVGASMGIYVTPVAVSAPNP